jgi:hypothetical protein
MKLFVRIAATYLAIIGLASLLAPQAASGQMGHSLSPFDIFVARSLGAAIVAVAWIDWSFSSQLNRTAAGLLWANLFMNASLAVIDIAAVMHHTTGPNSWFGINMHGLLMIGFLYFLYRIYHSRATKE